MRNFLTPLFAFLAFLLALLVSLSLPINKSITLFSLDIHIDQITNDTLDKLAHNKHAHEHIQNVTMAEKITFGLWGYCIPGVRNSMNGTSTNAGDFCGHPKTGYTVDQPVSDALGNMVKLDGYRKMFHEAITGTSIVHVVVVVLAFLTMLISLSMLRPGATPSRLALGGLLGLAIFTSLLTTVAFVVDILLVSILRQKLAAPTANVITVGQGNAAWLMLVATIAMWLGVGGAIVGLCTGKRTKSADSSDSNSLEK